MCELHYARMKDLEMLCLGSRLSRRTDFDGLVEALGLVIHRLTWTWQPLNRTCQTTVLAEGYQSQNNDLRYGLLLLCVQGLLLCVQSRACRCTLCGVHDEDDVVGADGGLDLLHLVEQRLLLLTVHYTHADVSDSPRPCMLLIDPEA